MSSLKTKHLLQTKVWAEFQESLGKKPIYRSGDNWSYTAYLETGYGKIGSSFSRLYVPYGPACKDKASLDFALKDLSKVAKKFGVDYIRIEPVFISENTDSIKHIDGYKKLAHSFQPDLTIIVDLDRDFEDVVAVMSKTNRYLWRKAFQNGLRFEISYSTDKIDTFLDMMQHTALRTNTKLAKVDYYKNLMSSLSVSKNAGLAFVSHDGKQLVSTLFVDDFESKTRYYMYAGSYDEARKYSANAPLVVFLMKDAHDHGMKYFDLFGVSPKSEENHSWAGISKFKRLFGGHEVAYMGTWEKPIKLSRYKVMNFARKFSSK